MGVLGFQITLFSWCVMHNMFMTKNFLYKNEEMKIPHKLFAQNLYMAFQNSWLATAFHDYN